MRLAEVQALLDTVFHGVEEGAPRMDEPRDPRFAERPSAVWLEYRWYVEGQGLAEVFIKWKRVEPGAPSPTDGAKGGAEVEVLRLHLLGASDVLRACARRVLEAGTPSAGQLLELLGEDGVHRECSEAGSTRITLEYWPLPSPEAVLPTEAFQFLAAVGVDPHATAEERYEAVDRLSRERSPRVARALLAVLEVSPSLSALRRLSEWGETGALVHLERALAAVAPDNPGDLWTLLALERRLKAYGSRRPSSVQRASTH